MLIFFYAALGWNPPHLPTSPDVAKRCFTLLSTRLLSVKSSFVVVVAPQHNVTSSSRPNLIFLVSGTKTKLLTMPLSLIYTAHFHNRTLKLLGAFIQVEFGP